MRKVYLLFHEKGDNDDKFNGIYSSFEDAQEAIDILITKPGFKLYPRDCFKINEYILDTIVWRQGFSDWNEL